MERDLLTTCPTSKRRIATIASRTPISFVARRVESLRPLIRIFNYHAVPHRFAGAFEQQLQHIARRFRIGNANELEQVLRDGPGDSSIAFFSFDDGLANHHEHAASLLERWGVTGFFSVPAGFPDADEAWFGTNVYPVLTELHTEPRDVEPMTWDQLADLAARGHRILAHGFNHVVLTGSTPEQVLEREIVASRAYLEAHLPDVRIDGFCWPGRSDAHAIRASKLIEQTYSYSFGTQVRPLRSGPPHDLPRMNLEASWPADLVDLQLSGVLDGLYAIRRLRGG